MKYIFLFSFFIFITFITCAQNTDTVSYYIDGSENPIEEKMATYFRIGIRTDSIWQVFDLYLNVDKIRMKAFCKDDSLKIKVGICEYYSKNGRLLSKGYYLDGKRNGLWKWRHENGQLQDSVIYKNNIPVGESAGFNENGILWYKKIFDAEGSGNGSQISYYTSGIVRDSGTYFNNKKTGTWFYYREDKSKACEVIFEKDSAISAINFDEKGIISSSKLIEQEANYPGGENAWNNYLGKKLGSLYDQKDYKSYSGTCNIQFIINKDGTIINVETIETTNKKLSDIVTNFINSSKKWNPAIQYNLFVKAYRRQRFTFYPE